MTPTQLRAFHAVASTGSFTAAARALHTSQPPITTHVRELEERYGVELFHRHGRGAELTAVGRKLLAITQRVIANHEEAVELLQDAGRLKSGHLHLGVIAPFGITALLARFREAYPQIQITATPGNSSELLEGLRRYRLDVALVGQVWALAWAWRRCPRTSSTTTPNCASCASKTCACAWTLISPAWPNAAIHAWSRHSSSWRSR